MKKTIKIDLNLLIKAKFQENQNTIKKSTEGIQKHRALYENQRKSYQYHMKIIGNPSKIKSNH